MSRSAEDALAEALSLKPPGWALPARLDSGFAALLTPFAAELARCEARAEALLLESEPLTSSELLPDYERVLGPDPCTAGVPLSLAERRRLAHARWTAQGGASVGYFVRVAAALGVPIQVEEIRRTRTGRARCGDRLCPHPAEFFWRVHLPQTTVVKARAGAAASGDPIGRIVRQGVVECVIRRLAPSHTLPVFLYDLPGATA